MVEEDHEVYILLQSHENDSQLYLNSKPVACTWYNFRRLA